MRFCAETWLHYMDGAPFLGPSKLHYFDTRIAPNCAIDAVRDAIFLLKMRITCL